MLNAPGDLLDELARAHRTRWTHSDELLALILERLDALFIYTVRAWSDPKKVPHQAPTPYRYPRPNTPKRRRRMSTPGEIMRFLKRR